MDESVAPSSITSGISAGKQRGSKRSAKAKSSAPARALGALFAELARIAELSAVERRLRDCGFRAIAGTDEVGRGCLAGPVVSACVILDPADPILRVNDSKLVEKEERAEVCRRILRRARAVSIGVMDSATIDRVNILRASKLSMFEAVQSLPVRPDVLLLDAVVVEELELPQVPLIQGDRRSISIAAASIVAKVYRDSLMQSYHERYPVYGFNQNKGYATEGHQAALKLYGPSPIHRKSFEGVVEPMMLFGVPQS